MPIRTLPLYLLLLVLPFAAKAEFSAAKLALIDRPFVGEQIALSPDGRYLAYTQHTDNGHTLFIADQEKRVAKSIPLTLAQRADRTFRRLVVLRWAAADRLVLQEVGGQLVAISPDGSNVVPLWDSGDNGIVNDYTSMALMAVAEPPRVLAQLPDEPDTIWVESSARQGFERLASLFKVNTRTGKTDRAVPSAYYDLTQIALYGRGNLIYPPPPVDPEFPSLGINSEASSTGLMLYDRQGWPRLLYEQSPTKTYRQYTYTEAGRPNFEPYIVTAPLDRFLGQRTYLEMVFGKTGEFDLRAGNYFGERSYPIAFDYNPDVVYIASTMGRDTYGIYSLNLKTKERIEIAPKVTGIDLAPADPEAASDILVFDDAKKKLVGIRYNSLRPRTYWLDQELGDLQAALDLGMPRHAVEILSWDTERRHFAIRASSEEDPGALFTYDRTNGRLEQITSRAPWLAGTEVNLSAPFSFDTPTGVHLTGYITLPKNAKVDPPPLLIYCAPGLWERAEPGFNREAEMLADMGIVVMRLNYRGTAGFGRAHLTAIQQGIDTVPVEDFMAAIDWLAAKRPIDRKRVIVMGEGFGGYVALRAVKNHPNVFRAAIGVNAPTNLSAWASWQQMTRNVSAFSVETIPGAAIADPAATDATTAAADGASALSTQGNDPPTFDFRSLVKEAFVKGAKSGKVEVSADVKDGDFTKPVLLISNNYSSDATPFASLFGGLGFGLQGMTTKRMTISGDFVGGSLKTRTAVFTRIDEFLNEFLYNYEAEIGELKELPAPPPAQKSGNAR